MPWSSRPYTTSTNATGTNVLHAADYGAAPGISVQVSHTILVQPHYPVVGSLTSSPAAVAHRNALDFIGATKPSAISLLVKTLAR